MGIVSSGIDRVRAFGLAGGIGRSGRSVDEPLSVLVMWRSGHEDKLHHVYVNGRLAGVTGDCGQRKIEVPVRLSLGGGVRIEVYAVEPWEAGVDFSDELASVAGQALRQCSGQAGRFEVSWGRGISLPFEGMAEVYSDGGSGQIDYGVGLTEGGLRLWPAWQDKGGFGLSKFGRSDFGFEGSAAVGFGRGGFGEGEFGFDAEKIGWESGELETGKYKFAVKVTDGSGNEDADNNESGEAIVIRKALGAGGLGIESYDKSLNEIVVSVS